MRKSFVLILALFMAILIYGCHRSKLAISKSQDTILVSDTIQYHPVRVNKTDGSILPWYSSEIGASYDTVLTLVWNFWDKMAIDSNGLKYYMNHQVWKPEHDMRGLGGDQLNMALSSWTLLYAYTGNPAIIENMRYIADNYLTRSLSDSTDQWPYIPYPYNTVIHSGRYDGDMRNGKGITQPDKAGNFGLELVNLFKITGDNKYLEAAKRIASTLMAHIIPGDSLKSPLPFRVNAKTGETGFLFSNTMSGKKVETALYTSNWSCTMELFLELMKLHPVYKERYERSFTTILEWMKKYPVTLNKWGPFFEDIPGWSDTQTNAITFAMFILKNPQLFPDWQKEVKGIIEWTHKELGNKEYSMYKVEVMNEQTVYRVPGNSHSSRQASVELMYTILSGDTAYKTNAIRTLNWATYTVANDGRNRYIRDDIWLTDGYGDYVRHYLRAMAAMPELAPSNRNRLLGSTSVITSIEYAGDAIRYTTFDRISKETLRMITKPKNVSVDGKSLTENNKNVEKRWSWNTMKKGGVLTIFKTNSDKVVISI